MAILSWLGLTPPQTNSLTEAKAVVLDTTLRLLAILTVPMAFAMWIRYQSIGWQTPMYMHIALLVLVNFLFFSSRLLSEKWRSGLFLATLFFGGMAGFWLYGLLGNGLLLMIVLTPALASIFRGGKTPLVILLAGSGIGSVIMWMWVTGQRHYPFDPETFLRDPTAATSLILLVLPFSIIFQVALHQLHAYLEQALNREKASNAALQNEIKERERISNQLIRQDAELIRLNQELQLRAATDGMTGLWNRGHFFTLSNQFLRQAQRYHYPLALLMIDIDFFKKINDNHGHATGDKAIQALVSICQSGLREADYMGRLGGEEFGIVLPKTSAGQALLVAQRLRQRVESLQLDNLPSMTISLGLATLCAADNDVESLLARADAALYQAKRSGRNQVCLAESPASGTV